MYMLHRLSKHHWYSDAIRSQN